MTAVSMEFHSKHVYFDVLDDIVDEYNNTYHRAIKMKPIDVKSNSYAEYSADSNEKDSKFKVGDHVRILKYKIIFAKGYTPNWSEKVFDISKIKNTVPWNYVINDLNGEEIRGTFYEEGLQNTNQKDFVFDFSVHYKATEVDKILDIHKYLMEKNNIK